MIFIPEIITNSKQENWKKKIKKHGSPLQQSNSRCRLHGRVSNSGRRLNHSNYGNPYPWRQLYSLRRINTFSRDFTTTCITFVESIPSVEAYQTTTVAAARRHRKLRKVVESELLLVRWTVEDFVQVQIFHLHHAFRGLWIWQLMVDLYSRAPCGKACKALMRFGRRATFSFFLVELSISVKAFSTATKRGSWPQQFYSWCEELYST